MKFRKKPVVIDAVQIKKGMLATAPQWIFDAINDSVLNLYNVERHLLHEPFAEIETLEGVMRGGPDDWIIKGVHGELYPCKPDIFEATYEMVEEV